MHQENKRTLSLSSAENFRWLVEMLSNLSILYDKMYWLFMGEMIKERFGHCINPGLLFVLNLNIIT